MSFTLGIKQTYRMDLERNKQQQPFKPVNECQLLLFLSHLTFHTASIGRLIFESCYDECSGTWNETKYAVRWLPIDAELFHKLLFHGVVENIKQKDNYLWWREPSSTHNIKRILTMKSSNAKIKGNLLYWVWMWQWNFSDDQYTYC